MKGPWCEPCQARRAAPGVPGGPAGGQGRTGQARGPCRGILSTSTGPRVQVPIFTAFTDVGRERRVPGKRRRGRRRHRGCRAGKCSGSCHGGVCRQPLEGELGVDALAANLALMRARRAPSTRGIQRGRGRGWSNWRKHWRTRNQSRGRIDSLRGTRSVLGVSLELRGTRGSGQGRCCRRGVPRAMGRSQGRCGSSFVGSCAALIEEVAEVVPRSGLPWRFRNPDWIRQGDSAGAKVRRRR